MKMMIAAKRAVAVETAAPADGETRRLGDRVRAIRSACRQILGIPDYDAYLAHMAVHHPGEAVLTRREFFARSIDRKYGRNGSRCC